MSNKLKYFRRGRTESCYGPVGLIFDDRVFSMSKIENDNLDNGNIIFTEECDGYFSKELTHDEAIEMLEEAIYAIKNDLV